MTLLELLRRATGYLEKNGSTSPRLDAELLLAASLGIRRLDLYLQFERPLSEREIAPFRALSARRARGEPVAYLLGHKEFMTLDFEVTPAVLVPSPDTEVLVERAVTLARALVDGGRTEVRVADVGTGSGCIAISVAHFVPAARVWASDDDAAALEVAARNVARHQLADRVQLAEGDLLAPALQDLDLIVANLPYVAPGAELPREVLAEPAHALFAEDGGAALVNRLLTDAPTHLAAGGVVLAELDEAVSRRLSALTAYAGHELRRDLSGHVRVLEARLGSTPRNSASSVPRRPL